jgi:hypothetical protein
VIQDYVLTQNRLFVIISGPKIKSFGLNFMLILGNNLKFLYLVDFERLLPDFSGLKNIKILKKIDYPSCLNYNSMVLIRAVYGQELIILHFQPNNSFLTAFPFLTYTNFLESKSIAIPFKVHTRESLHVSDKLEISSSYYFFSENQGQLFIQRREVYLHPRLQLKRKDFLETKTIEIKSWTKSKPLSIGLNRSFTDKSRYLSYIDQKDAQVVIGIHMQNRFPVDVEINPMLVRGNVFDVKVQCEKDNESYMNFVEKLDMVQQATLFQSRAGSMTRHANLGLNPVEGLVYFFNRNLFWVMSIEGELQDVFYLNKYLVSPPHLMHEFRGEIKSEKLFLNEKEGVLLKAITNSTNTCLFFYQINTTIVKTQQGTESIKKNIDNLKGIDLNRQNQSGAKKKATSLKLLKVQILKERVDLGNVYMKHGIFVQENRRETECELVVTHWQNLLAGNFNDFLKVKLNKEDLYALESVTFTYTSQPDFEQSLDDEFVVRHMNPEVKNRFSSDQNVELDTVHNSMLHRKSNNFTEIEMLSSSNSFSSDFEEKGLGFGKVTPKDSEDFSRGIEMKSFRY